MSEPDKVEEALKGASGRREGGWVRKIIEALNLGNLISIAVLAIGIPASLGAWNALVEAPRRAQEERLASERSERATKAAEAQARIAEQLARRAAEPAKPPSEAPRPEASGDAKPAVREPAAPAVNQQADLTRPYLYVRTWELKKPAVGEKPTWVVRMVNAGRPVTDTSTYMHVITKDSIQEGPTCVDTAKYGGSHPIVGEQGRAATRDVPLTQSEMDAFNAGAALVLLGTSCYQDPITKKKFVTHVCLQGYSDGRTQKCAKGNEAS